MSSPHPPLKDEWLEIGCYLYHRGPTHRIALRKAIGMSCKQYKLHSKLMKMRGIIDIHSGGIVFLTGLGELRVEQTLGISTEAPF